MVLRCSSSRSFSVVVLGIGLSGCEAEPPVRVASEPDVQPALRSSPTDPDGASDPPGDDEGIPVAEPTSTPRDEGR